MNRMIRNAAKALDELVSNSEIMNKPQMDDAEKDLNRTGYIHIAFSLGSKTAVDELTV